MRKIIIVGSASAVGLLMGLFLAGSAARGDDWPMFGRDRTRNTVSREKDAPTSWQIERRQDGLLIQPRWNIKWETRLGTHNFAAPVVAGGLVWVGTTNTNPDGEPAENAAVLMCFRERDGKLLWRYLSPQRGDRFDDPAAAGIACSPLVEGERLWFTTNLGEVVCLDIAPLNKGQGEPRIVWKLDMGKDLGVRPVGAPMNIGILTCSIGASWQGRIYVTTGNGVAEDEKVVPAPKAPSLLCLDKNTGKVLWSDSSPGKNILRSQRSSPLVAEVNGRAQVLAAQGDGWLRSFDARTGELLWKFDLNPKGAKPLQPGGRGERCFPIATPVLYDNKVYIAIGRDVDDGSGVGRLWCIDITKVPQNKDKDLTPVNDNFDPKTEVNKDSGLVWHRGGPVVPAPKEAEREFNFERTMSTVAIHNGLVLAAETTGYVQCLDARTGRHYWTYDAKATICSSPLIADGKVYIGDENGIVHVLALSREKKLLARNDMDEAVNAPAVFANGVLYVVTDWKLYAIRADGKGGDRAPGYWPQWRGADRSAVSVETGLLKTWPEKGPPLAWKFEGLGEGVASVAVAGGRVYTLGYRDDDELVTALEETTGKKCWSVRIGPALKENPVMRWLSQRTPTVDNDRLYAFTARGELICLKTVDGKEVWRKDYLRDFGGRRPAFGYCDRPLVDGGRLICAPGGKSGVMALDKKTGDVLWKSAGIDYPAGYSATVLVNGGSIRHYVVCFLAEVVGISARDGKVLWQYKMPARTANNYTPLVHNDLIFCASGYGAGIALLKLVSEKDGIRVKEVYARREMLPPWHDATVLLGEHVYAGTRGGIACFKLATGEAAWRQRDATGNVSVAAADGHLYLRTQKGEVTLVEATPERYVLKGKLQIPDATPKPGSTAPVIAGGRLYLRDDDRLFCYDVKEGATGKPAPADAVPKKEGGDKPETPPRPRPARHAHDVFMPTPQDVVEHMLEVAKVKRDDAVYDLGCGDGRIVVTAAKKYGCRAAGYDIDPECVRMSLANVRKQDVARLVTIERKDLFTLDLSRADVIALYLLPRTSQRLLPQLAKLKPGARIVSHAFEIPGLRPDRVVTYTSKEDDLPHKIYLWTAPFKKAEPPK
ncbi:MAG TPA: PQQ-binding-like beta-propeller repeat protein [Gemmataceae bacterium]|jgi:outer membrane protein assembly factor BamB/precorrin-6B methylase 2